MKAYLNDAELKKDFVKEIKRHQEADQIIQGTYAKGSGKNWKGCAVGCSIHSLNRIKKKTYKTSNHSVYETELGIPRQLAYLEDRIFEGLDVKTSKEWPLRFSQAIRPGADLSLVVSKFMVAVLKDENFGVYKFAHRDGKKAIDNVVALYERKLSGSEPTREEWLEARDEASLARRAAYAAYDAASDAAAYAAYAASDAAYDADAAAYDAAADAASYAAAYAADAAADAASDAAADADAAGRDHYKKMADRLIELLEKAGE
jgi:hypothetical protein